MSNATLPTATGLSCVYLIGAEGTAAVKIGTANDVTRRLREIQYMSPVELTVLWTCPGDVTLEHSLHSYFATKRSHGEWFVFKDEDPVAVVRAAVESGEASRTAHVPRRRGPRIGGVIESDAEAWRRKVMGPPCCDSEEWTEFLYGQILKNYGSIGDRFTLTDLARLLAIGDPSILKVHMARLLGAEQIRRKGRLEMARFLAFKPAPEPVYQLVSEQ